MVEKHAEPTTWPHVPLGQYPAGGGTGAGTSSQGGKAVETKAQMTSTTGALAVWAGAGLPLTAVNPATPPGPLNSLVLLRKGRDTSPPPFLPANMRVQGSQSNPNQKHGRG